MNRATLYSEKPAPSDSEKTGQCLTRWVLTAMRQLESAMWHFDNIKDGRPDLTGFPDLESNVVESRSASFVFSYVIPFVRPKSS